MKFINKFIQTFYACVSQLGFSSRRDGNKATWRNICELKNKGKVNFQFEFLKNKIISEILSKTPFEEEDNVFLQTHLYFYL